MPPRLVTLPARILAACRVVGRRSELSRRVPPAWMDLVARTEGLPGREEPGVFYGAFRASDPADEPDPVYEYWVGVPVHGASVLPEGLVALHLPAGTFACGRVAGGPEAIDAAYGALARWIDEQGRRPRSGAYGLERYDTSRQSVLPPYGRFDYDVYRPVA